VFDRLKIRDDQRILLQAKGHNRGSHHRLCQFGYRAWLTKILHQTQKSNFILSLSGVKWAAFADNRTNSRCRPRRTTDLLIPGPANIRREFCPQLTIARVHIKRLGVALVSQKEVTDGSDRSIVSLLGTLLLCCGASQRSFTLRSTAQVSVPTPADILAANRDLPVAPLPRLFYLCQRQLVGPTSDSRRKSRLRYRRFGEWKALSENAQDQRNSGRRPRRRLDALATFFLGYPLGWARQDREEHLRKKLLSDVHASAKWCVNGQLANVPNFYEAFAIKPGQPMLRSTGLRVKVW